MPTYEYRCKTCEHEWEEFQSIKANPTRKCPECGKLKAQRIISAGGGIIFKGSGFYQTDYRSESWKQGEKADRKSQDSSSGEDKKSSGEGKKTPATKATSTKSDSSSE